MYQLAKNPQYIDKITDELSVYSNIDSLKPKELEKLPYLNAVIRESLRVNPPYPSPLGRVCPKEGRTLNGHFIPGGVSQCHRNCLITDNSISSRRPFLPRSEGFL